MKDPIQETIRQTQRYWYVDGLAEMGTGTMIFLYGLLTLVSTLAPEGWVGALMIGIGQPLFFIGGLVLVSYLVKKLKERITYPRTGYMAYARRKKRAGRAFFLGAGVAIVFSILSIALTAALRDNWIPALVCLPLALAETWWAYSLSLKRFYILAVFTFLLGIGLAILPVPEAYRLPIVFAAMGASWAISGAVTLYHYLRTTEPASEVNA